MVTVYYNREKIFHFCSRKISNTGGYFYEKSKSKGVYMDTFWTFRMYSYRNDNTYCT